MAKMDRIYIRDLQARCIVGIYPDERTSKQDVVLNLALEVDLKRAGESDEIADTVNYKDLKKQVLCMVEESSFFLIEKMATEAAEICLAYPGVSGVTVTVDKPGALRFARSVAVEIYRAKSGD